MVFSNLIFSPFLLSMAFHWSLVRGQNGSCVAGGYANCNGSLIGDCYCDLFCYSALDCCPDIVQTCQPPNGDYVCYGNGQCTQLVSPSSAASVSGCCNSVGSTHFMHISEPTECSPCSAVQLELRTRNGSVESLGCINTTVMNYIVYWEKLTSSVDGNCSNLNLSAASGGLSGSEETGERMVVSNGSILEFDPVVFGDEGCYRCVVAGVPSDLTYIVTVSPEDSISAVPLVINAERNTTVEFTCSALGGPRNSFTWIRMSDGAIVARESVLQIAVKDVFVGSDYQCLVVNEAGNDTDTITLNVAPFIHILPTDVIVTTAESFSLMCNASGYPNPSISWVHNGTAVNENDRIIIIQDSSTRAVTSVFGISAAIRNDSGEYICIASSDFQTVSSEPVDVFVQVSSGRSSTEAIVIGVVTSVAIIAISIVVVVIITVIRRQSGTLCNDCNLRNLNKRGDATSTLKGTDISMTECPAYVETRYQHQQNTNDPNNDHMYECVGLPFHQGTEACEHHYEEPTPRSNVYSY